MLLLLAVGVEALKSTDAGLIAGSKSIKVNVRPVDLKVDIISPDNNRFTIGETIKIKVKITYPDNSPATGIIVNATPVKKSLALVQTGSGIYEATYSFSPEDRGRYSLRIFAIDSHDNLAFVEKAIFVVQPTLLDLFIKFWYITVPGVGLVAYSVIHAKYPQIMLRYYQGRLKSLENLKKHTQERYFLGDGIDEPTYRRLIQDADRKMVEVKTRIKELKAHVAERKEVKEKPIENVISKVKQQLENIFKPSKKPEIKIPVKKIKELKVKKEIKKLGKQREEKELQTVKTIASLLKPSKKKSGEKWT